MPDTAVVRIATGRPRRHVSGVGISESERSPSCRALKSAETACFANYGDFTPHSFMDYSILTDGHQSQSVRDIDRVP